MMQGEVTDNPHFLEPAPGLEWLQGEGPVVKALARQFAVAVPGEEGIEFLENPGFVVVFEAQRTLSVDIGGHGRAERGRLCRGGHGRLSASCRGRSSATALRASSLTRRYWPVVARLR